MDPDWIKQAQQELDSLKRIPQHPNIVNFIDSKEDGKFLWLFTEFCEHGDLDNYVLKNTVPTDKRFDIMVQVTKGIRHLHHLEQPIAHRDIKPGNIVLTEVNGKIVAKLCDMGIAKAVDKQAGAAKSFHTYCGTEAYMAPELYPIYQTGRGTYDMSVDIYSAGVFFYTFIEAGDKQVLQPPQSKELKL